MDDLEDLARRQGRTQNGLDPMRARPEPWFVGSGRGLMIGIVSLVAVLLVARGVSTLWMIEDAWNWSQRRHAANSSTPSPSAEPQLTAASLSVSPAAESIPPPDPALAGRELRGNPGLAFSPDAYPMTALRAGEQGRTVARLLVNRAGRPTDCTVKRSSGSEALDEATCAVALARVRFQPARDADGVAIAAEFTLPVRWVLPD